MAHAPIFLIVSNSIRATCQRWQDWLMHGNFRMKLIRSLLGLKHRPRRVMTPTSISLLVARSSNAEKFRASLAHFDKANSADRLIYKEYVPTVIEAEFDAIKKNFDDEWFNQNRLSDSASPVFICGMFRSGSTLVEQILAAHSAFTPAGEREFFSRLVETELPNYPRDSELITKSALQSWAARYQEESDRIFGRNTRLTDKRPDNFLYLGLIKALFPAAKIIVTHRAWHDIAWSIYSTRFGQAQHYATDIRTIRHYINLQTDLMTHWQSLFGQDIFTVEYEALVTAPRETITNLLNFLGSLGKRVA